PCPGRVLPKAFSPRQGIHCHGSRPLRGTWKMTHQTGKRVLLVEDDPIVAMVVEDTLRDMGLEVLVDLSLVDALSEIETSEFDAALIDVGLRGESAYPVMVALQERRVPFAVMSGGDLTALAAEF